MSNIEKGRKERRLRYNIKRREAARSLSKEIKKIKAQEIKDSIISLQYPPPPLFNMPLFIQYKHRLLPGGPTIYVGGGYIECLHP
jgi:hypothetical protein